MTTKLTTADIADLSRKDIADELGAACEYTADWETAEMSDLQRRLAIVTGAIVLDD